jgi:hypothetical protein
MALNMSHKDQAASLLTVKGNLSEWFERLCNISRRILNRRLTLVLTNFNHIEACNKNDLAVLSGTVHVAK